MNNIALFSPIMKLNPRNPGRQANLDVGVHGLFPLWSTLGDGVPERKDHSYSFSDTREDNTTNMGYKTNKTAIPTKTKTRQLSDKRYYDTCKPNAPYDQWY